MRHNAALFVRKLGTSNFLVQPLLQPKINAGKSLTATRTYLCLMVMLMCAMALNHLEYALRKQQSTILHSL